MASKAQGLSTTWLGCHQLRPCSISPTRVSADERLTQVTAFWGSRTNFYVADADAIRVRFSVTREHRVLGSLYNTLCRKSRHTGPNTPNLSSSTSSSNSLEATLWHRRATSGKCTARSLHPRFQRFVIALQRPHRVLFIS